MIEPTQSQMDAAIAAMNDGGFDIRAPWECDLDDQDRGEFNTLKAAVAAALASEWRDISTAPRDGTPILCWRPDPEFSPITGIDLIWWEPAEMFWTQDGDTPIAFVAQPTHWMPLPTPPQRNEVKP